MSLVLTNAEIVGRLPMLADEFVKADSGTVTSATNSKLTYSNYTNCYICFLSGTNYGVDRIITSYNVSTGTATFDALDSAVTNQTLFAILENGYLGFVAQAELLIDNYFRNSGLKLELFTDVSQLKEAHLYKTLELICASLMKDGTSEDIYFVNYERYKTLFETEMARLVADYDSNEDGNLDDGEDLQSLGQVWLVR